MTDEEILISNIADVLLEFSCDLEDMNHSDFQGLADVRAKDIIELVRKKGKQ